MGLSFIELQNFKNSYAQTLQIWNNKFQKAWPNIASTRVFLYVLKKCGNIIYHIVRLDFLLELLMYHSLL